MSLARRTGVRSPHLLVFLPEAKLVQQFVEPARADGPTQPVDNQPYLWPFDAIAAHRIEGRAKVGPQRLRRRVDPVAQTGSGNGRNGPKERPAGFELRGRRVRLRIAQPGQLDRQCLPEPVWGTPVDSKL